MPPGHPTILLKCNKFNMGGGGEGGGRDGVSVKRSISVEEISHSFSRTRLYFFLSSQFFVIAEGNSLEIVLLSNFF